MVVLFGWRCESEVYGLRILHCLGGEQRPYRSNNPSVTFLPRTLHKPYRLPNLQIFPNSVRINLDPLPPHYPSPQVCAISNYLSNTGSHSLSVIRFPNALLTMPPEATKKIIRSPSAWMVFWMTRRYPGIGV